MYVCFIRMRTITKTTSWLDYFSFSIFVFFFALSVACSVTIGKSGWSGGTRPTVGQGLLSLKQIRVEGECLFSSVSSLSFLFLFLPCPSLSSLLLPLFSLSLGDDTKMTHKGWLVVKPQHNQKLLTRMLSNLKWKSCINIAHCLIHFYAWKKNGITIYISAIDFTINHLKN